MSDTITITPEERRLLRSGGYGDYERLRLLTALEAAEAQEGGRIVFVMTNEDIKRKMLEEK